MGPILFPWNGSCWGSFRKKTSVKQKFTLLPVFSIDIWHFFHVNLLFIQYYLSVDIINKDYSIVYTHDTQYWQQFVYIVCLSI